MSGQYVTFVDSDDWIDTDFIESLMSIVQEEGADIAVCPYYSLMEDLGNFHLYSPELPSGEVSLEQYVIRRSLLSTGTFVSAWGKIFASKLFRENYLRFPYGAIYEDQFLIHRLFLKANKIYYLDQAKYCWRRRSNSITTRLLTEKAAKDDFLSYRLYLSDLVITNQLNAEAVHSYKVHIYQLKERLIASNFRKYNDL